MDYFLKKGYDVTVAAYPRNPMDLKNAFEYYISQLKETDDFLGELLAALQNYPEPVVLVIYGDHLPALDFQEEEFRSGSLLTTEYVIWSNDNRIAKENRNITAYQLSSYTLSRCGISSGLLTRFHQQHAQDEDYLNLICKDHVYWLDQRWNTETFGTLSARLLSEYPR